MIHDVRPPQPTQPSPTPVVTANPNSMNPKSVWGKQTSLETQDDGQYHPNQQAFGEEPNPLNSAKSNGYFDSQSKKGGVQANQQTTSAQTESTPGSHDLESPQAAGPSSQQVNWPGYSSSLTAVVIPTAAPIQQETLISSSPTALAAATGLAAVSALPNHPAPGRSGTSMRAAAIALSVIVALAIIGALILLPLFRKRRSLQKALANQQNNSETAITTQGVDLSSLQPHSEKPMPLISGRVGPEIKKFIRLPCSVFNHVVNRIRRAPTDHDTELEKDVYSMPKLSTPTLAGSSIYTTRSISDAGSVERSKSPVASRNEQSDGLSAVHIDSSDYTMTEEQPELLLPTRTQSKEPHGVYGAASLENPSIGNLLAASPLINNVHVVEMDFIPSRDGQLELHTGQLLGISQVFDNGWVR